MKKYTIPIALFALIAFFANAYGILKPFAFTFTGRWQPSEDGLLIDKNGFQDIQNLRKDGQHLKGVSGHTKINTLPWNVTNLYPTNAFHFKKDQPAESHFIISATLSDGTYPTLYQNTTAIPSAGAFASELGSEMVTDTGIESWTGDTPDEFTKIEDGSSTITNEGSEVHGGSNSAKGTIDGSGSGAGLYQSVTYTAGTQYYLSIWLYGDGASDLRILDDDGALGGLDETETPPAAWTEYTYSFTANDQSEMVRVIRADPADVSWVFYIDDISLKPDTPLHVDASGAGRPRFATAPQGNMLYANGAESMIWGGDELLPVSFITATAAITGKPTNPKDYSLQVRNTLATAAEVAFLGGANDAECVLLMHFDGADAATTMPDSSVGGTHGNANVSGTAQYDTDQAKFGASSLLLDGNSDYIDYADDADWFFDAGLFTIDFWVRFNSFPSNDSMTLFSQCVDADNYYDFDLQDNAGVKTLYFFVRSGASTIITVSKTWSTPSVDQWYHIALIRGWGGNANDFAITVNGTQIGSTTTDSDSVPDLAAAFEIGRSSLFSDFVDGWIEEFRVTKGKTRWTAAFTPPARPYAVASNNWLIGSYRPLKGVKYYIGDANNTASTMTASEWNGSAWQSLTITDNTDTGASLAQDGTVTWTATDEAKVKLIEGLLLYWYQFAIDDGDATIKTVTVDAPFQSIKNIWSGETSPPIGFHVYDNGLWENYTDHVNTPSSQEYSTNEFAASLDAITNTEYVYVGFVEPVTALQIGIGETPNTVAATITVYYWDGAAWVSVGTVTDETNIGGDALAGSGFISWNAPSREEEFPQNLFGLTNDKKQYPAGWKPENVWEALDPPKKIKRRAGLENISAYYYKLMWSATLTASTSVDTVQGVPTPKDLIGYDFPGNFQNRAWLFGENSGSKNKAIHSAFNAPDVWNGIDSGELYFGNDEELTSYATIYNMYKTSGVEQMLVTKANETYRVTGDSPETWDVKQMSGNVGNIAPLSMAVCEVADITQDTKRHVAIWQSSFGVVMSDGASIVPISEDIRAYWDQNDSRYIPTGRQDDSIGWYNPNLGVYKLLISSGSGQTTHNVELEYSLKHREWTKLYRENGSGANPLQVGTQVKDTDGNIYTYGATNEGTAYRLENGQTWASTAIEEYVHTKDLLLERNTPYELMRHTVINYLRVGVEQKGDGTDDIDIQHFCNQMGTATVHGTDDQAVPTDIDMMSDSPFYTEDCYLGECLSHSFKFVVDITNVDDGMELLGMGLYYEPLEQIIVPE